jgi:hypothetical protein
MKLKIVSAAAVFLFAGLSAFAQNTQIDDIVGVGTTNYVPVFTGSHRIGNSLIYQTGGNIGIGTTAPGFPVHILRNSLFAPPGEAPSAFAVETAAQSDTQTVAAIQGLATSTTGGGATAILGTAYGANSIGLFGNSTSNSGGGGVVGSTASADFSFSAAIAAWALANTGSAVALFAQTYSPNGTAGYFLNRSGGNIIVGHVGQNDDQSVFRVDSNGKVFANGGFQPSGADFAESMAVVGDRSKYAAGDLLVIEPTADRHVALARQPYSSLVAGIYSTKPGMLGSTRRVDESPAKDEVPLAVVGIVPCKVSAENGPIQVGDLLVTSSTPGHAMRGTDRGRMLGAVVGKALEPLPQGTGVIQVLVTLQ